MARSPSASADVTRQPVGSQWTTSPSGSGSSTRLPSLAKLLNGEPYHSPSLAAHPSQELQSSIDAPHVLGSTTNSQGSSWAPPFQISSSAQSNPRKRSLPLEEETVGCSATTSRSGDSDGAHEQETDNAARPSQSPGAEDGGATPPSKRELKNSRRAAQNRAAQVSSEGPRMSTVKVVKLILVGHNRERFGSGRSSASKSSSRKLLSWTYSRPIKSHLRIVGSD